MEENPGKSYLPDNELDRISGKDNGDPLNDFDYRELIEGLPAAIYACDAQGRITFYNEAAVELWGRRPEIGKDLWCGSGKIYKTDGTFLPMDQCPMAITLKEGRAVIGEEIRVERPDGIRVNVLPHPRPLFDNGGRLIGAINMLVDVSEKKAREEALHESEAKYRRLSESLEKKVGERNATIRVSEDLNHKMIEEVEDYAILSLDRDGRILNWNKGAEKIKGYTEQEIVGKNFRIFYLDEDREKKLPEQLIEQAKSKGKAMHEGWRMRKDGTRFWGSIVITALHDDNHNVIGFSKVTRDLTERKLAEDKLRSHSQELEFQNKQLEEYAYVASHDLQEPLRKIKTFANLLQKSMGNEEAMKMYIEKIDKAANRMESLIKDVLKYSQLSRHSDFFTATDLNKIIDNVQEDFEMLIEQKKAKIEHTRLPIIKGIPIQLHQLFSNLVGNSLKFTNKEPRIKITNSEIDQDDKIKFPVLEQNNDFIKIQFRDNGIGIAPEYTDQIFKLFQRLNPSQYGTGIGLALCKKIVENHNGLISVTSQPGEGAVFNIFLPVN
jgi:PAS domain S-box-containing protein